MAFEPKIFSGPVWTAVLKKKKKNNSGSTNEHRLFLCATIATSSLKRLMVKLNGFKQDLKKNLKTVKSYTKNWLQLHDYN